MKVLITTDCAAGGEFLAAGKVIDLAADVAIELLRIGRAAEAPVDEPKPKAPRKAKAEAIDGVQ